MSSFFQDIITPNTLKTMRALGDNIDMFGMSIKQILNFQFLLYDSLNELAGKFSSLKSEVSQISSQVLNVDDAVKAYLHANRVSITTREGIPLDDAIDNLQDKIANIYRRLDSQDSRTERLETAEQNSVKLDDWREVSERVNRCSSVADETAFGVQMLQKEVKSQSTDLDEKWDVIKSLFKQKVDEMGALLDQKPSIQDLDKYCKHSDLAELCTVFSTLPQTKRPNIKEIIPQIFMDSSTTMDEKLRLVYDRLSVEKGRLDLEDVELVSEFDQLKNLIRMQNTDELREAKFTETVVRDIATDSGYTEPSENRKLVYNKGVMHRSIETQFKGPDSCEASREVGLDDLVNTLMGSRTKNAGSGASGASVDEVKSEIVKECQICIENTLAPLLGGVGSKIDKDDIHLLVTELRHVEEFKSALDSLKLKMNLKVDQSLLMQEIDKCIKREEFFEMMECTPAAVTSRSTARSRPATALTKVKKVGGMNQTPPGSGRRQKPEVKTPATLVPARNSKMVGVNEKYLIGDDGKTYLKESSRISDRSYREPSITGEKSSRGSYYDRSSKMSVEMDGVDAVIDFQPFVPASSMKRNEQIDQ